MFYTNTRNTIPPAVTSTCSTFTQECSVRCVPMWDVCNWADQRLLSALMPWSNGILPSHSWRSYSSTWFTMGFPHNLTLHYCIERDSSVETVIYGFLTLVFIYFTILGNIYIIKRADEIIFYWSNHWIYLKTKAFSGYCLLLKIWLLLCIWNYYSFFQEIPWMVPVPKPATIFSTPPLVAAQAVPPHLVAVVEETEVEVCVEAAAPQKRTPCRSRRRNTGATAPRSRRTSCTSSSGPSRRVTTLTCTPERNWPLRSTCRRLGYRWGTLLTIFYWLGRRSW